jgi:hypothetical protein
MLDRLEGWLPTSSRDVRRGERVFIGDHSGPGRTPCVRGLTILARSGRLFLLTAAIAARVVQHG